MDLGNRTDAFEANRSRLFGLAYRLLGETGEAEDVLQDAYLRWSGSPEPHSPAAWLTKVVTNLCLNRLTSARARREHYAGPWLPEPVLTEDGVLGPLDTVVQRESVSLGMLMLLERLSPAERAVFVLRSAFDHGHGEIAEILDISEANSRQLYRRARAHLDDQPRFEVDRERQRQLVDRFLAAALHGDVAGLARLLADDVTAWADGGGQTQAARRPITGLDQVGRDLAALGHHPEAAGIEVRPAEVNGAPAVLLLDRGQLRGVVVPAFVDGRIAAVHTVVNPAKLVFAAKQRGTAVYPG